MTIDEIKHEVDIISSSEEDNKFQIAVNLVIDLGYANAFQLLRVLDITKERALAMINTMSELGIIKLCPGENKHSSLIFGPDWIMAKNQQSKNICNSTNINDSQKPSPDTISQLLDHIIWNGGTSIEDIKVFCNTSTDFAQSLIESMVEKHFINYSQTTDIYISAITWERWQQIKATTNSDNNQSNTIDFTAEVIQNQAVELVIEEGIASTSFLQKTLKLSYVQAARLIDTMEKMGVVGPFEGSKPRQVLMTKQEWYERKLQQK